MRAITRRWLLILIVLALAGAYQTAAAQPTRAPTRIGVVNLDKLVRKSPQAQQAKKNMAARFAKRKSALEKASDHLQAEIDRLSDASDNMSDAARDRLKSQIRDDKHQLQLKQTQYNDDVSDAEQKELDSMRSDLRKVIDAYARDHGYDLIVGDSVLYASDKVDITDAILRRLRHADQQKDDSGKSSEKASGKNSGKNE